MAAALSMDWTSPPPPRHLPREHQFLPLPPRSWGDDPARLHQLMMGSLRFGASSSSSAVVAPPNPPAPPTPPPAAAARSSSSPSLPSSSVRDLGGVFDHDQPLPSGWERCLDLKSGEVFIVKSASNVNAVLERPSRSNVSQQENWQQARESTTSSKKLLDSEPRQDWSLRWLPRKATVPAEDVTGSGNGYKRDDGGSAKIVEKRSPTSQVEIREPLCLDLDLKLTSEHPSSDSRKGVSINELSTKASGKRTNLDLSQGESFSSCNILSSSTPTASARAPLREENMLQQWNWQRGEKSIQEAATESTMAAAVCSKCLMYALLRKTNPTCPGCGNPIILDSPWPRSSKRPRLELAPDDLSLSH